MSTSHVSTPGGPSRSGLRRAALLALPVLVALAALASRPRPDAPAETTVTMTADLKFAPATVTVPRGTKVVWKNTTDIVHTVTSRAASVGDPANVGVPDGADDFDSGNMQPGATFSHTFTVPGTYRYVCVPHEGAGMAGRVVVE